ncbi:MAG: hypothetical protein KME20_08625 [Kaiparowitsia implicata GSE-PSE-MK54-09C]|jgi:hypothetical protein|nr:hypothetical protein [Kaiparowitsia implicata GSE-PSE-MK54-09C]
MPAFSCADESCQAAESPIGSAAHHAAYVVLECPPPWPSDDLSAPPIPEALRQLSHSLTPSGQRVRWLLVHAPHDPPAEGLRLSVFQQPSGLSEGYHQQAFQVPSLEAAAPVIRAALRGQPVTDWQVANSYRELLICTHGSHDRCCGRYGLPFYRQALTLLSEAQQQNVRIWQASHFSGHRFAPTVLTFPDGRYYGRLNLAALRVLINRQGNLQTLMPCYRGWGILPDPGSRA